jgi:DNA-binding transcriptional ArsR family regulator
MGRPGAERDAQLVAVFRALGDPSRCRIVELLREAGELRVGDVAAAFEMSLNGVSKHLKILEAAGLVQRRREGTTHYISMRWEGLSPMVEWLDVQRQAWERRLDAFEDLLTQRKRT